MPALTDMKYKATERYVYGWTDWRAVYGTPTKQRWWQWRLESQTVTNLVGTLFIMLPLGVIAYYFWQWMGWF